MAIEVTLSFNEEDEPKTAEDILKAYEEAKAKQKYNKANEALENKRTRIIDGISNTTTFLNVSLRKQLLRIVEAYSFTEKEIEIEYKRLNPEARKKRNKK